MLVRRKLRKWVSYDKLSGVIETECKLSLQSVGYVQIEINNKNYRLIDVIYILVYGEIPKYTKPIQLNKNSKLDFRLTNIGLDETGIEKQQQEQNVIDRRLIREAKKKQQEESDKFKRDRSIDFSNTN